MKFFCQNEKYYLNNMEQQSHLAQIYFQPNISDIKFNTYT